VISRLSWCIRSSLLDSSELEGGYEYSVSIYLCNEYKQIQARLLELQCFHFRLSHPIRNMMVQEEEMFQSPDEAEILVDELPIFVGAKSHTTNFEPSRKKEIGLDLAKSSNFVE
jgi:hypothetical protein